MEEAIGRRFPKGDRKALWSPPQRRNPAPADAESPLASSAEGAVSRRLTEDKPSRPQTRPHAAMVAAALSAAVTSPKPIGETPTFQAEPSKQKRLNPIARRSSGGSAREGLLSEKPPPSQPPSSSHVSSGGDPGEALLCKRSGLPRSFLTLPTPLAASACFGASRTRSR